MLTKAAYLLVLLEAVVLVTVKESIAQPEGTKICVCSSRSGAVFGFLFRPGWLGVCLCVRPEHVAADPPPCGALPPPSWARGHVLELLLLMSLDSRRATYRIPKVVTEVSPDLAGPAAPMSLHTPWVLGLGGP